MRSKSAGLAFFVIALPVLSQADEKFHAPPFAEMPIETFILDGRELAAKRIPVRLSGFYILQGRLEAIYGSRLEAIRATQGTGTGQAPRAVLLTDNASRDLRKRLLECQSNPTLSQVGCQITVNGIATSCTVSNIYGVSHIEPCVNVEDGYVEQGISSAGRPSAEQQPPTPANYPTTSFPAEEIPTAHADPVKR